MSAGFRNPPKKLAAVVEPDSGNVESEGNGILSARHFTHAHQRPPIVGRTANDAKGLAERANLVPTVVLRKCCNKCQCSILKVT